jgi:hypothetical protein
MEFPAYWLRRPELLADTETLTAFDRLLDQAQAHGPDRPIDYQLSAPKWQFLCHAAERANLVLHGSGDPGIGQFEPRQPADSLEFSNRRAVFAATDGIWPIYYAVLDRERYPMMLCNACVRACLATGEVSDPHYFFSISDTALAQRPWRPGVVYLLPAGSFETQPPLAVGDVRVQVAQAASPVPVTPVAKLMVDPGDFPFLEEIRGHDDELLQARIAADPAGFPWAEERADRLR